MAFIGLSEVVAGIAATTADGWIASAFTCFAVIYPTAVTGVFFILLWKMNWVFYPSSEFSDAVSPEAYVEAMKARSRLVKQVVTTAVEAAVDASLADTATDVPHSDRVAMHRRAVEAAQETVDHSFIEIDLSRLGDGFKGVTMHAYLSPSTTVADFLNQVWYEIRTEVRPFRYLKDWVLRDLETGEQLAAIGTEWARKRGRRSDTRTAESVGLVPGRRLIVERL